MCRTIRQCMLHLVSCHRILVNFAEGRFETMWCRDAIVADVEEVPKQEGACVWRSLTQEGTPE